VRSNGPNTLTSHGLAVSLRFPRSEARESANISWSYPYALDSKCGVSARPAKYTWTGGGGPRMVLRQVRHAAALRETHSSSRVGRGPEVLPKLSTSGWTQMTRFRATDTWYRQDSPRRDRQTCSASYSCPRPVSTPFYGRKTCLSIDVTSLP